MTISRSDPQADDRSPRRRPCPGWWVAGGLAGCLAVGLIGAGAPGARAGDLRLERNDSVHLGPRRGAAPPVIAPRSMPRRVTSQLVYSLTEDDLRATAEPDPELSMLCRYGAFRQQMDGWLYARTDRRRYGLGFSNGANLYDPRNRRAPERVYFFRDADTGRCRVLVAPWRALAGFAVRRTAR